MQITWQLLKEGNYMRNSEDLDIVFLIVPCWGVTTPSLSIASLSSYAKQYNFGCKCIDLNAELFSIKSGEFEDAWDLNKGYDNWDNDSYVLRFFDQHKAYILNCIYKITKLNPKVVSFSTYSTNVKLSLIIAKIIKNVNPEIKIIFGGPQIARFLDSEKLIYSYDFIDGLFFGEGEGSVVEYLTNLKRNNLESLPIEGTIIKNDQNCIIDGGPRNKLIDIKIIPFPDYGDFDLSLYANTHGLPIASSRGCLNNCFFCTEHEYMPKYRFRLAEDIFNEMKSNMELYPHVNFFHFHDSVSNGNIKELDKLCDYIINSNLSVKFSLDNVIMRKEMTLSLCKKLKQAGCELMGYGMETCVPKLWGIMGKNVAYKQKVSADEVVKNTAKAGIRVGINIMFGIPGETEYDFQKQLKFIKRNKKYINLVNPSLLFCLFPKGCKVYNEPEKYGVDLSKGSLYWETLDGTNNYLTRLNRFLEFVEYASKLRLINLFGDDSLNNISELKGKYFFMNKQYNQAKNEFTYYLLNIENIDVERHAEINELIRYCEMETHDDNCEKSLLGNLLISGNTINQKILDYVDCIDDLEHELLNITMLNHIKYLESEMPLKDQIILRLPPKVRVLTIEAFLNKVILYVFRDYFNSQKKFNRASVQILDLMLTRQQIIFSQCQNMKSIEK